MDNNNRGNDSRSGDGFRTSSNIFRGYDTTYSDLYAQEEQRARENGEIQETPREPKRKKKKRRKKHYMLRIVVVIAVIVGIYLFTRSPVFEISTIVVENNSLISNEEILAKTKIQVGDNMFEWSERSIKSALKENPYVKTINVRRELPDRFIIEVVERIPTACIMVDGKYLIIDSDGEVMDEADNTMSSTILEGLTVNDWDKGDVPEFADKASFDMLMKMVKSVNNSGLFFKKVALNANGSVNAYVTDTLICKGTPDSIISSLEGIKAILYDLSQKNVQRGVIEIDGSNIASFSPVLS